MPCTPADRLSIVLKCYGEPDPLRPLSVALGQGRLAILHRERRVDLHQPLVAPDPVPLVVLSRSGEPSAALPDEPVLPVHSSAKGSWHVSCGWVLAIGFRYGSLLPLLLISGLSPAAFLQREEAGHEIPILQWPRDVASGPPIPAVGLASVTEHSRLALYQCRIAACLNEVGVRPAGHRPFLPEGCPLIIHNPFVRCPQVELLSPLIGTGFALQLLPQDHANRRGWQPIVPVQPQPDEHAVHLIPAAADPSLAAIVLRRRGTLHPICLPRILPAGPSRSLTLSGRFGRLREPYPLRRVVDRPLHLRDGDCLWLDHGPFGPPPPEPVNSFGIRSVVSSLLLFALAAGREPLWRFAHLSCPLWRCTRIGPCLLQGAVPMCL